MSINALPIEEEVDTYQESLAERLARGAMPLPEALRYAADIATTLRDLHAHGLTYGAVTSRLILLSPSGATLRPPAGLTRLGDGSNDVTAFGTVLDEMFRRRVSAGIGLYELREDARALAALCRKGTPEIRQVLIALRILALKARQAVTAVQRPVTAPVAHAPVREKAAPWQLLAILRQAMNWRPLAGLTDFALSGK